MLPCQRHLFSLPDDVHYINCASRAPLLKTAEAAGVAGLRRQLLPEAIAPDAYFAEGETVRTRLAALVGAVPDAVALVPAVSYGMAIAAHQATLQPGRNVVVADEDFPSIVYPWMDACDAEGATLRRVPRPPAGTVHPGREWSARLAEAIDTDTAAVAISAVGWTDGVLFDLGAIGARAREVGALFIVDGTQCVGAMPFDWTRVRPDLLVCASYKWLLGPYQQGVAIVGERLREGRPFEHHWSNRAGSEDVTSLAYRTGFRAGARRFDAGEHANPITLPMLAESLRQVCEWGPENVAAYCAALYAPLDVPLREAGWELPNPVERCPHIFALSVPDEAMRERLQPGLATRNVRVSFRGPMLRVSPHVYNSASDMEALADVLLAAPR